MNNFILFDPDSAKIPFEECIIISFAGSKTTYNTLSELLSVLLIIWRIVAVTTIVHLFCSNSMYLDPRLLSRHPWRIFSPADHHLWRCDLQERALASGVLHLHQLQHLPGRPALHLQGWQALLRGLLRGALRQALHRLHQAHHRWAWSHCSGAKSFSCFEFNRLIVVISCNVIRFFFIELFLKENKIKNTKLNNNNSNSSDNNNKRINKPKYLL